MSWKSPFNPAVAAVLLLSFSLASWLYAAQVHARLSRAEGDRHRLLATARQMDDSAASLDRELRDAARASVSRREAPPLSAGADAVPLLRSSATPAGRAVDVLELLRSADSTFSVRWRTLALGGLGVDPEAGGTARDVDALFTPLQVNPNMRVARWRAEGDYRSLTRLTELIDALQARGAAVTNIRLEGEQVSLAGLIVAKSP